MALSFNTSLKNVAVLYLEMLHAKVTATSVKKDIQENPYYPSLFSLSDTFSKYRINNNAFEVDKKGFVELKTPFVAIINVPGIGKDFVLVNNMSVETVSYFYKTRRPRTLPRTEFLKQYQNIILVAEPDEHSSEMDYDKKLRHEKAVKNKKIAWFIGFTGLLLLAIKTNMNTASLLAFSSIEFIKLIGIIVVVLLLLYETDNSNALVSNICSGGEQTNCDAVLGSRASKFLGISWGEIGFFYFAATSLWLLLPFIPFTNKIQWIAVANAFAAPYILFSIYYQRWVVRQWCPLCLTVQGVLLTEFVWSIINFWGSPLHFRFDIQNSLFIIPCVFIPILSWYALKYFLVKAKDAELYKSAYKRVQHNPDIFNSLLQQEAKAPNGWQQLGIRIGNPAAINSIIKVCNPFCGPCA